MQAKARRLFQLIPICLSLVFPAIARADQVATFHSDVVIARDNIATITETIVYDPQREEHHGIIRFVPAQFQDDQGQRYYTKLKLLSVMTDQNVPYHIADQHLNRKELYLKIGYPDVTFTTPQTYIIKYQISPLVVKSGDQDRLTLNITGQQWDNAINQASVSLKFAPGVVINRADCYTGYTGSTERLCTASVAGSTATIATTAPLPARTGLTVDLFTQAGSVSSYLQPNHPFPLSGGEKAWLSTAAIVGLVWLAALARLVYQWLKEWQLRRSQTIIPIYEPPDGLTPAQLSIIESPKADTADITATIIHLAVRRYLKIELVQPKTWFRQANYQFTKLKSFDDLAPFESKLATGMFGSADTVDLPALKAKTLTLPEAVREMRVLLGRDLTGKGYFASTPNKHWRAVILGLLGYGLVASVFLVFSWRSGDIELGSAYALLSIFGTSILALGLTYIKVGRTLLGNVEWAKVKGFRWFLSVTEKDRLAFTDAPERTPELFSAMLPYAIALKVEKQWAKQFAGIDVSPAVGGWYGGGNFASGVFAADFASGFASSFSSAVSTNFAGASGGGSAGGGGGGGGGGGW